MYFFFRDLLDRLGNPNGLGHVFATALNAARQYVSSRNWVLHLMYLGIGIKKTPTHKTFAS